MQTFFSKVNYEIYSVVLEKSLKSCEFGDFQVNFAQNSFSNAVIIIDFE